MSKAFSNIFLADSLCILSVKLNQWTFESISIYYVIPKVFFLAIEKLLQFFILRLLKINSMKFIKLLPRSSSYVLIAVLDFSSQKEDR